MTDFITPASVASAYGIDGKRIIALAEMAGLINDTFRLVGRARLDQRTPYTWWDRHLHRGEPKRAATAPPTFPDPIAFVGGDRRKRKPSPLFRAVEVIAWYADWKGIPVRARKDARMSKPTLEKVKAARRQARG
jgi:hypothetical protein